MQTSWMGCGGLHVPGGCQTSVLSLVCCARIQAELSRAVHLLS